MTLINDNFLLNSKTAVKLYQKVKDLPIYDFHCHLDPKEIYENKNYDNITQLWLGGDHYKWRLMRAYGIEEAFITGSVDDFDKFQAFMHMLPYAIVNPMYHWCALELKRYFNEDTDLDKVNISKLYKSLNKKLAKPSHTPQNLIKQSNVKVVCTTDDPCDDLKYHKLLNEDSNVTFKVIPTFRPDSYVFLNHESINTKIDQLNQATDCDIQDLNTYIDALKARVHYFDRQGARSSDQSFEKTPLVTATVDTATEIYNALKRGEQVTETEQYELAGYILTEISKVYEELGWVVQFHLGPTRNNNSNMFKITGPDSGFDSVGEQLSAKKLNALLDHLEQNHALSDTIIYPNNGNDHLMVQATAGNFTNSNHKVQLGAAWWFNDTKEGMEQHLVEYANVGLLSKFVGMLTDSRSMISYTRHEYFRRILCNFLGDRIEKGEIQLSEETITQIVKDICYNNAVKLFKIEGVEEV
ncbi:glucuronate isomerase [Staphylococcus cohnii]|uniref:glucuronate isomerase n=1 Tax=Staphylococcus cohnii species complex TaxID=3239053 RepID=UPI00085CBBDC|nr:glucuronate isomerase [Staphylococcus ureilyticus]PTF46647.1 glucuronate isomerase [Staphylococcus cohnii]SCT31059.1 glucuronate isomerase [Staphylococcus cohnii subsp. cohnii]MDQ7109623.1 glucuronate isomerase [Staphylococcus ureilyticus]PTG41666.1 glucuronate isomerase [Staphylococcus cohnii]PUZ35814.1 glucuronate isomerase [Staphylococcus cohnii]